MAKITDPDFLNLGTEVVLDTTLKTIELVVSGNLSTDGVTLQCVYSFLKERWKVDTSLIKFPFPIEAITTEAFEVKNSWNFKNDSTRYLIRDAGWAIKDDNGVSKEEWANITTLGGFDNPSIDRAYFAQTTGSTTSQTVLTGPMNQAIKIYGDVSNGNFNYRNYFKIFLREGSKKYDSYDLPIQQNIPQLTYQKYALPLSNSTDLKVTHSDAVISGSTPYTGMTITYYNTNQSKPIGGSSYNFNVVVDGNGANLEQIYEFLQYSLRKDTDIDNGAGVRVGKVQNSIANFVGDTLTTTTGVFIENFNVLDVNRIQFTDVSNVVINYPYVAAGTLTFNTNLINDVDSKYWMFFTNANGNAFGTSNAIIVNNQAGTPIAGGVSGQTSINFTFDYDNNIQGGRTSGTDANVTIIALGLNTAQYTVTTSTITKSTQNNISLVSPLERNYVNN
jgi:hypothetical protein